MTDEGGHTTTYLRDTNKRVKEIDYPDGQKETFAYNGFGQVTQHNLTTGGIESYSYDPRGLKTEYRDHYHDPVNKAAKPNFRYKYDALDRLTDVTDALGVNLGDAAHTTSYAYNTRDQVETTTLPTNPDPNDSVRKTISTPHNKADGTLKSTTDQLGHVTSYFYDDYKRLITMITPLRGFGDSDSKTTTYDYIRPGSTGPYRHTANFPFVITSPALRTLDNDCDNNLRKTSSEQAKGTPEAATTTFTYDNVGNLTVVEDALTHKTTTGYDERNRPMSIKDELNNTTTFMYDAGGRKGSVRRPNGQIISFDSYDQMNRLLQQTVRQAPNPDAVIKYTYDPSGGMLETMTDPNQNVYTYAYDFLNRKTKLTYPPDSGGQIRTETWTYNSTSTGTLSQFKNRSGNIETFTYDSLYRVTLADWNDGVTPDVTTSYDAANRVTGITNSNSTIARTYYFDNLLKDETNTYGDGIPRKVNYTYDPDGLRDGLTYPNNAYNFSYTYTERSQLDKIQAGGNTIADYGYDAAGNLTSRTLDNSTSSTFHPDALNRIDGITHSLSGTTRNFAYGYDSVGNRNWVKRDGANGDVYDYDLNDQVTVAKLEVANPDTTAPGPQTIVYDAGGNRSSFTAYGTPGYYSVNALNQYTSRSDTAPSPTPIPAPVITGQPAAQTVNAGQNATFRVTAQGAAPLSYQWRKNGTNISGATGTSYTTPATTAADNNALFSVAVTNPGGTTLSSSAKLTVQSTPPTITVQPADISVVLGLTAKFTVTAGNATSYQWRKNGANISGATASSYTTPATTAADNGALYSVVVSNAGSSVTSRSAKLTVRAAEPVFSPANQFQGTHPATTLQVSLHTSTAGAQMYYTLTTNGTIPTRQNGTLVPGQGTTITVPARDHKFLKAFAFKSGLADSNITTGEYDTTDPQTFPDAPTPSPGSKTTKGDSAETDVSSAVVPGSSNDKAGSQLEHEGVATTGTAKTGVTSAAITTQADYDGNGNMIAGLDGSTYTYDAQNRLLIATSNGTTDTFLYDGLNRQIGKKVGNQALFYRVYDGWDLLGEYKTGVSSAFWAYLHGAGGIVKNLVTNNYYYQDASGSTSHVANASGILKEYYRYDLQGQPLFFNAAGNQMSDTAIGVRHLFTGQQWYNEIGLYDLRNRYYSPDIGRFLQSDPVSFDGDSTNLYRYCLNDPVNASDPTGRFLEMGGLQLNVAAGLQLSLSFQAGYTINSWNPANWTIGYAFSYTPLPQASTYFGAGISTITTDSFSANYFSDLNGTSLEIGGSGSILPDLGIGGNIGNINRKTDSPITFSNTLTLQTPFEKGLPVGGYIGPSTTHTGEVSLGSIFQSIGNFIGNIFNQLFGGNSNNPASAGTETSNSNTEGNNSIGGSGPSGTISPGNPYGLSGVVVVYGVPGTTGSNIPRPPAPLKKH